MGSQAMVRSQKESGSDDTRRRFRFSREPDISGRRAAAAGPSHLEIEPQRELAKAPLIVIAAQRHAVQATLKRNHG